MLGFFDETLNNYMGKDCLVQVWFDRYVVFLIPFQHVVAF